MFSKQQICSLFLCLVAFGRLFVFIKATAQPPVEAVDNLSSSQSTRDLFYQFQSGQPSSLQAQINNNLQNLQNSLQNFQSNLKGSPSHHSLLHHTLPQSVPDNRIDIKRVVTRTTCPKGGFALIGNDCIKMETLPVAYSCPPTTRRTYREDGEVECEDITVPRMECPKTMELHDNMCMSSHLIDATFHCRDPGETLVNMSCVSFAPQPPPTCPQGFEFSYASNNERRMRDRQLCVAAVPVEFGCREGFAYCPVSHSCTKSVVSASKPICPANTVYSHSALACITTTRKPSYCPAGYMLHDEYPKCIKNVAAVPGACPSHFSLATGNWCEKRIIHPAISYCPPDYQMVDSVCIKQIKPYPECPQGFHLASPTRCEKLVKELTVCPNETVAITTAHPGHTCRSEHENPVTPSCSPGFILENQRCRRQEIAPPTLVDNYIETVAPVAFLCPEGFEYVEAEAGSKCLRRVMKGCDAVMKGVSEPEASSAPPVANDLRRVRNKLQQRELQSSEENDGTTKTLKGLSKNDTQEPLKQIMNEDVNEVMHDIVDKFFADEKPQADLVGEEISANKQPQLNNKDESFVGENSQKDSMVGQQSPHGGVCVETDEVVSVDVEVHCDNGGQFNPQSNHCIIRELVEPIPQCKLGRLQSSNQCVREVSVPVKYQCPSGTVRLTNAADPGLCLSYIQKHPLHVCPDGSQMNMSGSCVASVPSVTKPPVVLESAPLLRCRVGHLSVNECVETIRMPRPMMCPNGAIEVKGSDATGTSLCCVAMTDLIIPAPVQVTTEASFMCNGQRTSSPTCHKVETHVPQPLQCSSDSTFDGKRHCVKTAPLVAHPPISITTMAVPTCPFGAILRGTKCVINQQQEARVWCSTDYAYDGKMCIRRCPAVPVCPEGTTMSAEGCLRKVVVAPIVRVTEGCQYQPIHHVPAACSTCPRPMHATCHP